MSSLDPNDVTLANRNGTNYKATVLNLQSTLLDTDWIPVQRGATQYKLSGANLRANLGSGSPLTPALPPFGAVSYLAMNLSTPTNNVVFSLNKTNWSSTLSVPINTTYYVDWDTPILSAPHGSQFVAQINTDFPDVGLSESIDLTINSIDKVPDPFFFQAQTDTSPLTFYTANTIFTQGYNAPTSIWVSTDSASVELQVGRSGWFAAPTAPGQAYIGPNEELLVRHQSKDGSQVVTTTRVFIGYGTGSTEHVYADFPTTNSLVTVNTPSITSPSNGAGSINPKDLTVSSSAYTPIGAAGTHTSSDWQVATDAGFTNIVDSRTNDTINKTSWTRTYTSPGTFYIRVRYNSSGGYQSLWSSGSSFSTVTFYDWRVTVSLGGGWGGSNNTSQGRGGSGSFTLDLTSAAVSPSGSIQYTCGTNGSGTSPGSGYASGGSGTSAGSGRTSGGGAGSSVVRLNNTVIAVVGGGGGHGGGDDGNKGAGGPGGGLGLPGGGGGSHDSVGGGAGGSASLSANSGTGGQSDSISPSGAGGGGGGGGGRGNTEGSNRAGGGGGGGGGSYTSDGTVNGYRMYNVSGTSGGADSTGGYVNLTLYRSPPGDNNYTQVGSKAYTAGQNGSINISSI